MFSFFFHISFLFLLEMFKETGDANYSFFFAVPIFVHVRFTLYWRMLSMHTIPLLLHALSFVGKHSCVELGSNFEPMPMLVFSLRQVECLNSASLKRLQIRRERFQKLNKVKK